MDTQTDPAFLARIARRLAARLEDDPSTLAWVFARYRTFEGVDEAGLAAYFAVNPDTVPHIALCGRPREGLFPEDIAAVAERFGIDPRLLAELVRHVDALQEFRRVGAEGQARFLAAARDRAAEDTTSYDVADDAPSGVDETGKGGGRQ